MNQIINSKIILFCLVVVITSYKDETKKMKNVLLYLACSSVNMLLIYFIYDKFDMWIYVLIQIIVFPTLLRIIYKEKANILDVFYIMYLYLLYKMINFYIHNCLIVELVALVIAILCRISQDKIKKINKKNIAIWNEKSERALTLRCCFVVLFNIAFYAICNIFK